METVYEYLADSGLIKTIYLTLFHSLWQGAFIAGVAGIIMLATKKSSSAARYNLLLCSLVLFVACAVYTFVSQSELVVRDTNSIRTLPAVTLDTELDYAPPVENNLKDLSKDIIIFCNAHADYIVIFWFLIICLKLGQLFIGLSGTSKLRKISLFPVSQYWENELDSLCKELGISTYVKLAESGLAKVPLTVGYLKPVILFPLGLLAALPPDQVEAILLHELAHIRRKDYLVNILQSLVEILFFFNPAIWWLSSLLRAERENCCDDLAVARTSNKFNYVKALVAFEEYQGQIPQYASALTGPKKHLLNRVKRLIYNHNKTLNSMEKIILTCGLLATGMLTLAFTRAERHNMEHKKTLVSGIVKPAAEVNSGNTVMFQDTTKKSTSRTTSSITTDRDGKKYKLMSVNGKLTELYVDDVRIADEKISDYKSITDDILAETRTKLLKAEGSKKMAEQSKMALQRNKEQSKIRANLNNLQKYESRELAMREKEQTKGSVPAKELRSSEIGKDEQIRRLDQQIEKLKIQREKLERNERLDRSLEKDRRINKIETTNGDLLAVPPLPPSKNYQTNRNSYQRLAPTRPSDSFKYKADSVSFKPVRPLRVTNSFSDKAISELLELGIITDKRVKFTINNDELIVNGVKQSDEVHQKVLSKMSDRPSGKVEFSYSSE